MADRYDDISIRQGASNTGNTLGDKTERAADKALRVNHNEPSTTGDVVGESVGGLSGAATGAALGSMGGPIGTIIGGIAGAATGWWTGRAVSEAASSFDGEEDYYRNHYQSRGTSSGMGSGSSSNYDHARPAYQLGHVAGMNPDYEGRKFEDVEPDLRRGYESYAGSNANAPRYEDVRGHMADAYGRGQERRLVLSEEQLAVGKRQVQAGEVSVRTAVDTERVSQQVGLSHDEVSIERRPLSADSMNAGDLTIGEETIRVPLTREEAVVEKRVVPVEEVVVRTNTVTENQTVEDTVRRERLVTEGLDQQRGGVGGQANLSGSQAGMSGSGLSGGMSGAADRAHDGGLLDRAADKLDDLKDRVDGNPASRPGPDATDRRI
jgi:uncharacterized protein (TIGR02271 family)